ncbi:MAG: hypothetical protein KTR31_34840 [Myxococcales bacterium]|nr:hypothetical protein [Myxococcales bacterium]
MTLAEDSRAYLTAGAAQPVREGEGFVVYQQGERSLIVWVDEEERRSRKEMSEAERQRADQRESTWLEQFRQQLASAPAGSAGILLTPTRLGLSSAFVSQARQLLSAPGGEGGIRVPVEFFDADYRADGADRVSVMRRLFAKARSTRRVPQPYLAPDGSGAGADVVSAIADDLAGRPSRARLRIIDGSAGGGKSVAFQALALQLHESFRQAKGRGVAGLRPIAFTERQLRGGRADTDGSQRVGDLIEACIATELARPVTRAQFEWLLVHGHTAWMFDGLDEVYSGDGAFFETVGALMDAPGSRAQILLCTRDSLLTTSAHLRVFVADSQQMGRDVELIELAPWDESAWRHLAWIRLEQEREGRQDSPRIEAFVQQVTGSPVLRDLMGLPFYCDQILEMADDDKVGIEDDFDVLTIIVNRMIEREWNKDLFDWSDFAAGPTPDDAGPSSLDVQPGAELPRGLGDVAQADGDGLEHLRVLTPEEREGVAQALKSAGRNSLLEILQSLAHARQRSPSGSPGPLPVEVARSLTLMVSGLDPGSERGRDAIMAILQFAFFGAGEASGTVSFSHPIVADFLAARHAVQRIRDHDGDPTAMKQAIGPLTVPPGSVFVRYLEHAQRHDRAFRQHVHAAFVRDDLDPMLRTFLGLLLE